MLRVRTFFLGVGIRFSPDPINISYGVKTTTNQTEYGAAVGYDTITTINSQNYYVLNGGGAYNTSEATLMFKTTQLNQQVTIEVRSSSDTGDYMCAGQLDSDSIVQTAVKVQGTSGTQTYTYTVPTSGDHYIKFFFRNNATGTAGENKGYFRMVPFDNTKSSLNPISTQVQVKSLGDWTLYSKSDWITSVNPQSATKGEIDLNITCNPNYGAQRQGNITLQDTKSGDLFTITVIQEASPSQLVLSRNYVVSNDESNTTKLTVELLGSSTQWTATNTSQSWYKVTPTSGVDGQEVTVTFNSNSGAERTSNVTFTGNNGGQDVLTLEQETYICSCECVSFCSCDIEVDCPTEYTNHCYCDTIAACTCDDVCTCDNNRNYCSCDTETCSCNSQTQCTGDTCACNSNKCTSDAGHCSCNSDKCSCDTETCSCNSDDCSCDNEYCYCNSDRYCSGDTCSCNSDKCSCDSETCACDRDGCSCEEACPSNICSCDQETCTCYSDMCACNRDICQCEDQCWGDCENCICQDNACTRHSDVCDGERCEGEGSCRGNCHCDYNSDVIECTCDTVACGTVCICNDTDRCDCENICNSYSITCQCEYVCDKQSGGGSYPFVCNCDSEMNPCSCENICQCNSDWDCSCESVCSCNSDWDCNCDGVCSCDSQYACGCDNICDCNSQYSCTPVCVCDANWTCTCESVCTCEGEQGCGCDNVCHCDQDKGMYCTCETKTETNKCTTEATCASECTSDTKCSCENYQGVN